MIANGAAMSTDHYIQLDGLRKLPTPLKFLDTFFSKLLSGDIYLFVSPRLIWGLFRSGLLTTLGKLIKLARHLIMFFSMLFLLLALF